MDQGSHRHRNPFPFTPCSSQGLRKGAGRGGCQHLLLQSGQYPPSSLPLAACMESALDWSEILALEKAAGGKRKSSPALGPSPLRVRPCWVQPHSADILIRVETQQNHHPELSPSTCCLLSINHCQLPDAHACCLLPTPCHLQPVACCPPPNLWLWFLV